MTLRKLGFALAFGLAAAAVSGSALAERGHGGIGLYFGIPMYGYGPGYYPAPYYYPPAPYYYYPPQVAAPASPPAYVEQPAPQAAPAQPEGNYWYYCAGARAYYPYVKDCPGGWQRVAPQPSN